MNLTYTLFIYSINYTIRFTNHLHMTNISVNSFPINIKLPDEKLEYIRLVYGLETYERLRIEAVILFHLFNCK